MKSSKKTYTLLYPYLEKIPIISSADSVKNCQELLKNFYKKQVIVLASGRSGLNICLNILGFNRYKHRLLLPHYISRCVHNAINPYTLPVTSYKEKIDAILIYHQFGYRQRPEVYNRAKESGWIIIEDSAQAFYDPISGAGMNSDAEITIVSFPKFFPTVLGGAVIFHDEEKYHIFQKMLGGLAGSTNDIAGYLMSIATIKGQTSYSNIKEPDKWALEIAYESLIHRPGPISITCELFPSEISELNKCYEIRRRYLKIFKEIFYGHGYLKKLYDNDVTPYAIPFFADGTYNTLKIICKSLSKIKVKTSIYHFDINQNQLQPDYRLCILIPCHQNISEQLFRVICDSIKYIMNRAL